MKVINLCCLYFILAIILLFNVGCHSTKFLVISDPPEAKVKFDGKYRGETPINIELKKGKLQLSKVGYRDTTIILSGSVNDKRFSDGLSAHIELLPEGKIPVGNLMLELIESQKGFEVIKTLTYTEADIREKYPNYNPAYSITNLSNERWIGSYAISPDGNTIIIEIYDQAIEHGGYSKFYSNLWSINSYYSDGMTRITQGKYFDQNPSYSPDGRFLYFSSNRAGDFNIWRLPLNSAGSFGELITSASSSDNYPQISPDGATLLFTSRSVGSDLPQIWSVQTGSRFPRHFTTGENSIWSPDGTQILFTRTEEKSKNIQIWKMNLNGGYLTRITQSAYHNEIHPRWSPDGSKIVFASDESHSGESSNYDIWLMNSYGSDRRQLTTNSSRDDLPSFSPDGKTIYFRSNRGMKWNIWKMKLENY